MRARWGWHDRVFGVRGRTALVAGAAVALAFLFGAVLLVQAQRRALTNEIETAAVLRANDLVAGLAQGSLPQDLIVTQPEEALVQIVDIAGRVVAATTNISGEPPITDLPAPPTGHAAISTRAVPVGDSAFRVVAVTASTSTGKYTVYVGRSLEQVENSVKNLVILLAVGVPPFLALLVAVTWGVTGRAFRPVERMRAEVETISSRDLHRRLPQPAVRDEIGRLAETMNHMLERLELAASREQRFVADASHELRSPLAAIRAQLEVDLAYPDASDWRQSHREVLEEVGRLQSLVDDLLALARSESTVAGDRLLLVDLDDLIIDELQAMRYTTGAAIDTSEVSGGQVVGEREQMRRMIRNLLDNAVRHARTMVKVTLSENHDTVSLTISDDGSGIDPADYAAIFERFVRVDDARARVTGGTGLGLAIVKTIVEAHCGTVRVSDANPGARFVVTLPAASPTELPT